MRILCLPLGGDTGRERGEEEETMAFVGAATKVSRSVVPSGRSVHDQDKPQQTAVCVILARHTFSCKNDLRP
jgi:hypothetical protein